MTEDGKNKDPRIRQVDELTRDAIIDIMNMLFSRDEESKVFHDILNKQIHYDFNFDRRIDIPSVKQGLLLSAVCFHCDLSLNYSADIFSNYEKKLSQIKKYMNDTRTQRQLDDSTTLSTSSISIFSRENFIDHYASSHVFSMDTLGIMQFINNNNNYGINTYPLEHKIAAIKQSLSMKKLTNTLSPTSHLYHLSELSRLYFEAQQYPNAAKAANECILLSTKKIEDEIVIVPDCQVVCAMMILLKISLMSNISDDLKQQTAIATQNVLKLLKFLVDDNHPLFFELTRLFIQDKVIKRDVPFENLKRVLESELQGMIRGLGLNHPRIAERYKGIADFLFENDRTAPEALVYYEKAFQIIQQMEVNSTTAQSKAECSYSMSLIYYYKNQMDQCSNYLGIALSEFQRKPEEIDRVSRLRLLRCYLIKQNSNVKTIIDECEDIWRFFDGHPFGKVKLIGYYKELILIHVETIAESWNRNMKIQFNSFSGRLKSLISENMSFPTNVRKYFLKIPLTISSIDQVFAKKSTPVVNRLIEEDLNGDAQFKQFQEKRLMHLIDSITESGYEVWRFIEKQFLILNSFSNSKLDQLYAARESSTIVAFQSGFGNNFPVELIEESSLNFFEALIIVFGCTQLQKIFCDF